MFRLEKDEDQRAERDIGEEEDVEADVGNENLEVFDGLLQQRLMLRL